MFVWMSLGRHAPGRMARQGALVARTLGMRPADPVKEGTAESVSGLLCANLFLVGIALHPLDMAFMTPLRLVIDIAFLNLEVPLLLLC